jgi:hypothetical protein
MTKHERDPKKLGDVISPPPPTEGEDVNVRLIARFGLGLLAVATLVSALLFVYVETLARYEAKNDPPVPALQRPGRETDVDVFGAKANLPDGGVRLQTEPFGDYETLREQEERVLGDYGWVDEKAGVVRLPIARAMELVVQRGLPVRVAGASVTSASPVPVRPTAGPTATKTRRPVRPRASAAAPAAPAPAETPTVDSVPVEPEAPL